MESCVFSVVGLTFMSTVLCGVVKLPPIYNYKIHTVYSPYDVKHILLIRIPGYSLTKMI